MNIKRVIQMILRVTEHQKMKWKAGGRITYQIDDQEDI